MTPELPAVVEKIRPYLVKLTDKNVIKLQTFRYELSYQRTQARQMLLEKRRQVLWPKDKEFTELDRKTRLDGDVAVYEANYEFLLALEELIKDITQLYRVMSSG